MIELKLFKNSEYLIFRKSDFDLDFYPEEIRDLLKDNHDLNFHPERKLEYRLSRYAVFLIYKKITNQNLDQLPINLDRSINWPSGIVGSISHSKKHVLVALGKTDKLLSIGIDIETFGRVNEKIHNLILNDLDLKFHPDISNEILYTLIFSAKESLYKALRPMVGVFFGFDAAYVTAVDFSKSEFRICLSLDLPNGITKNRFSNIIGTFQIFENSIITSIEILKES